MSAVDAVPATRSSTASAETDAAGISPVRHRSIELGDVRLFYREAGAPDAPAVLLLHGFAASSYMFRELIPQLARDYHVIAPDLPGFGQTSVAPGARFEYSFDNLTEVIDAFTRAKGLERYAIYVFDYGAPVGWRLAVRNPEKILAIVTQNGNGYEVGLSAGWDDMRKAWREPTEENREGLRRFFTPEMIAWQYTEGVRDTSLIAPEPWQLAAAAIERLGADQQMDLLLDYRNNIPQYEALHAFIRAHRPPILAIWGDKDPFFTPAGAEAFRRDNPEAEVHLLDTGHMALETHGGEIAARMRDFLGRTIAAPRAPQELTTPA